MISARSRSPIPFQRESRLLFAPRWIDIQGDLEEQLLKMYRSIVDEFCKISKRTNTSYTDCYKISPAERAILCDMLLDEDRLIKEMKKNES